MEALTAVSVAALTIYDMVKAVDKAMVIGDIYLLEKRGGKSGEYIRAGASRARARRDSASVSSGDAVAPRVSRNGPAAGAAGRASRNRLDETRKRP